MSYSPQFTTKDNVWNLFPANLKLIYTSAAISDFVMQRGEALVWAELRKNGRFTDDQINFGDIDLAMAAENIVLWFIAKNQILSGIFDASNEVATAGTVGININYINSKGTQRSFVSRMEREMDAPNLYQSFQRHINNYIMNPNNAANRIDEVEPRVRNAFERRIVEMTRNSKGIVVRRSFFP